MKVCQSCGGVLGRDCFNEFECMGISEAMEREKQDASESARQDYQQGYYDGMNDPERLKDIAELKYLLKECRDLLQHTAVVYFKSDLHKVRKELLNKLKDI